MITAQHIDMVMLGDTYLGCLFHVIDNHRARQAMRRYWKKIGGAI